VIDVVSNLKVADESAMYPLGETYSDDKGVIYQRVKIAYGNVYRKYAAVYIDTDFLVNPGRGFIVNGVMPFDVDTTDLTTGYKYIWVIKSGGNVNVELDMTDAGAATTYDKKPLVPKAIEVANYLDGKMMSQGNALTITGNVNVVAATGAVSASAAAARAFDDYVKEGDRVLIDVSYGVVMKVTDENNMVISGILADSNNNTMTLFRQNPTSVANMRVVADGSVSAVEVSLPNALTVTANISEANTAIGGCDATKVLKVGDIISANSENVQVLSITNSAYATMNAAWTSAMTTAMAVKVYTQIVPCIISE